MTTKAQKTEQLKRASAKWRAAHPERARQVGRESYHRQRELLGKPKAKRYATDEERRAAANERARRWRERNQDKLKAISKKSYDANVEQRRKNALDWYRRNRERAIHNNWVLGIRKRYGLTVEQYKALGDACGICGATSDNRTRNGKPFRLAVDHCHGTNRVRGLLCGNCNTGIGALKHDIELLAKAIDYLQRE